MRKWIVPLLIGVGTPVGCTSWVINHPAAVAGRPMLAAKIGYTVRVK